MVVTTADIKRDIKEKNVTFLRLMFTDIMGVMKNVEIPATEEQVEKVLSNKVMFDGSSIEGFVRINESDMYLYPDLNTWTIFPWPSLAVYPGSELVQCARRWCAGS